MLFFSLGLGNRIHDSFKDPTGSPLDWFHFDTVFGDHDDRYGFDAATTPGAAAAPFTFVGSLPTAAAGPEAEAKTDQRDQGGAFHRDRLADYRSSC